MALDERKAAILRAVVEEYIDTADPVGSARVAQSAGVQVSPATVRNEMAVLEREGYLAQPHTSAGRIPTDKGYRFFVDQLTGGGRLEPAKHQQINDFFTNAHGELEQMLHDTSRLLAKLTDYAAVVIGPSHEAATVRSVQLVGLSPRLVLLVSVLSNGVVEKHAIELDEDTGEAVIAGANAHLAQHIVGQHHGSTVAVPAPPDPGQATLVAAAVRAMVEVRDDESDHVFVGGVAQMASAFDAVETVRGVLATLEQQYVVVSLLRDLIDRGLSVAIGAEHGIGLLSECAVIVSPYEVDGEQVGTIGVLGPTRMHYPQALSTVAVVSAQLSRRLADG